MIPTSDDPYAQPPNSSAVGSSSSGATPERVGLASLSPREKQVLELLAEDCLDKEIADKLSIGYETVRTHIHHIFQKLHVRTRTGAVARFLRQNEG